MHIYIMHYSIFIIISWISVLMRWIENKIINAFFLYKFGTWNQIIIANWNKNIFLVFLSTKVDSKQYILFLITNENKINIILVLINITLGNYLLAKRFIKIDQEFTFYFCFEDFNIYIYIYFHSVVF